MSRIAHTTTLGLAIQVGRESEENPFPLTSFEVRP